MNIKFKTTKSIGLLAVLLFGLILSNGLQAQSLKKTFKYIKEGEIAKAEIEAKEFTADNKTSAEDLMLHGLASCLIICNENYQNYDPYKSLELYKTTTDINADKLEVDKFLVKYELSIYDVQRMVYKSIFSQAQKINTEKSFQRALSVCDGCYYNYEAITLKENCAYNEAKSIKSVDGYKYFIGSYAKSEHIAEIKNLLYGLEFQTAKANMSLLSMNAYLKEYSNNENKFVPFATHLRDSIAFSKISKSYSDYLQFLKQYPQSEYTNLVNQELPDLLYNKAVSENNIELYELFIAENPQDNRVTNAKAELEKLYESNFKSLSSLNDFVEFKTKYPNSQYNPLFKDMYSMIVLNDSLYSKTLTGEPTNENLNDEFIESAIIYTIKKEVFWFEVLAPYYKLGNNANLPYELYQLYGAVKKIITKRITNNPGETIHQYLNSDEFIFDSHGVISSHSRISKKNNELCRVPMTNIQIVYYSEKPLRFESITVNDSVYTTKPVPSTTKKLTFIYNSKDVLQSINISVMEDSDKYIDLEPYYFSYYENGIVVNHSKDGSDYSDFYSFYKSNPSIPFELYSGGSLWLKRLLDIKGNQYLVNNRDNDTVASFDKHNRPIKIGGYIFNKPQYQAYPSAAEIQKRVYKIYTEFDYEGNWTTREENGLTFKREIIYY